MILTSSWPLARVGVGQDQLLNAPDPLMVLMMVLLLLMLMLVLMVMGDKVPPFIYTNSRSTAPWRPLVLLLFKRFAHSAEPILDVWMLG